MVEIRVTEEERAAARLSPDSFRSAALFLHTAGYVVLRDALPGALVGEARDAFAEILGDCIDSREGEAWYQVSRQRQAVFWERGARWRIFPKLRPPLNDPRLLANPLVTPLLAEALGSDFRCKFVSSDTCVKGSALQAPHRELGAGGAQDPRAYIVNVPLVDCGLENGPLEVWPESHLWSPAVLNRHGLSDQVQDGSNPGLDEFARRIPSEPLVVELGSVLIRDPGMLHRGTPNITREPRTMLTLCYLRRDYDYDYGTAEYNLDRELFRRLDPSVQRLFPEMEAPHQPRPVSRYRTEPSTHPLA